MMNSPFLQDIRSEGREERSHEIAKNLKQKGVEAELIASATELSIEEIEQL